jgi:glycine/D-amino acid oxidase-like deaminating enzyme
MANGTMTKNKLYGYSHILRRDRDTLQLALTTATPSSFWLDSEEKPIPCPPLNGSTSGDLLIVGAGYCGLWTALIAKERDPDRSVIVLEARETAWAASGRNGGFCEKSLTHGSENGNRHFANELDVIRGLEDENFAQLKLAIDRYGIDAEYEDSGVLVVGTEPHQIASIKSDYLASMERESRYFEGADLQAEIHSPAYLVARYKKRGYAFVHPAKLAWGLKAACLELGVTFYEHTPVTRLRQTSDGVAARTPRGTVRAKQVVLATNGFPSLLARLRLYTVPIYDYVLATEPLTQSQLESIGWTSRYGITDSSREFHYYRKTKDNRIIFGGYDAVYHPGRRIRDSHDQRNETFVRLADHFLQTFPQLEGIRFTHKWGGMIDMSTKLVAFHGLAWFGKVAYSAGYTGLGVGATRFGAETMLDLLSGEETARTRLSMARKKPIPIPPEPLATPVIQLMRRAVASADANGGRDGFLLKLASFFGVGFGS